MIVSSNDEIPTQKVVAVLGEISTRIFYSGNDEEDAKQKLIRKAVAIGADAITNFSSRLGILDITIKYSGLAVKTDDIIPIKQVLNTEVCWNCGKKKEQGHRYCTYCYAKFV